MAEQKKAEVGRGIVAGVVGGLLGSWVMLKFIEGPGPALEHRLQHRPEPGPEQERQQAASTESVTMQAAETFYHAGTGEHLTHEQRAKGGEAVHYAFGALMGAAYGATAEYLPIVTVGSGLAFATVLWAGTDLVSVPAVGFAAWPTEEPGSAHLAHWLAHVTYGTAMETTRRLLRWLF